MKSVNTSMLVLLVASGMFLLIKPALAPGKTEDNSVR